MTSNLILCTLLNKNYLTRALVLHDSLMQYEKDFIVYLFPFYYESESVARKLQFEKVFKR